MITSLRAAIASSYVISGSGFAIANTIGRAAIVRSISGVNAPFTDNPTNTSAPFTASASVRAFCLVRKPRLVRVHAFGPAFVDHALRVRQDDVFAFYSQPHIVFRARNSRRTASVHHHAHLSIDLPTISSAFSNAAPEIIAVPCWSS